MASGRRARLRAALLKAESERAAATDVAHAACIAALRARRDALSITIQHAPTREHMHAVYGDAIATLRGLTP